MNQVELQTDLFSPEYARESRREGFRASMPHHKGQNERVLDLLRRSRPLSAKQIAGILEIKVTSVHRVLNALGPKCRRLVEEAGKIDGGEGVPNTLWRAK